MKRALWASISTFCSTSLDEDINVHDCSKLGMNVLLERAGYDVWLMEPYKVKAKQSSYHQKVSEEEAFEQDWDLIIFNTPGKAADQVLGGPWNTPRVEAICDFFVKHRDRVVLFLDDPRPIFTDVVNGKQKARPHRLYDLMAKAQVIVPSACIIDDPGRAIVAEYWKMLDWEPEGYHQDALYGSVYVGVKNQTRHRKKALEAFFRGSSDGFTAGGIKIKGVPSLSDHKDIPFEMTRRYNRESATLFLTGEPTHEWLTSRAIQTMIGGSIASIDPGFAGRQFIPDDILAEQTLASLKDLDRSLLTPEVYARQVEFVRSLRDSAATPSL